MSQQQSRGLPGFLRRTFRNSDSNVSATSNLPDEDTPVPTVDNNGGDNATGKIKAVAAAAAAAGLDSEKRSSSDYRMSGTSASTSNAATPITERVVLESTPTSASSTGSRKHLRTIAFPPLPHEMDANDEEGEGDTTTNNNSSSAKPAATAANSSRRLLDESNQSTTASTNNPAPKSYKEIQFDTILASPIIPIRDLRKLAWNGIPPHHRPTIWKILLGYLPANTSRHATTLVRRRREYKDAMKQHYDIPDDTRTNSEQETLRQVLVDVPRTMPEVPLFHNDRVRRCLSRLLYIWAMRHPASSYVQGINDLATPLIAVFMSGYFGGKDCLDGEVMGDVSDLMLEEIEADTYWCLTSLLSGIQDHYTSDQPGIQRMVMHLEELVNRIDADLAAHIKNTGIEFIQFAFKWMNCLLLREFHLSCVMRLWDTYLSEGDGGFEDFHVYVCASFLVHFSNELQQMGFDELFQFMQVRDSYALPYMILCI
jgi:hypothetical protein